MRYKHIVTIYEICVLGSSKTCHSEEKEIYTQIKRHSSPIHFGIVALLEKSSTEENMARNHFSKGGCSQNESFTVVVVVVVKELYDLLLA